MPFPVSNIKELCKKNKTDIKHVELALGFSNSTIARWENAKKLPPYDRVKRVADYFGVSVYELSDGLMADLPPAQSAPVQYSESDMLPIHIIARNGANLSIEDQEQLLKYAKFMFPEAFKDE